MGGGGGGGDANTTTERRVFYQTTVRIYLNKREFILLSKRPDGSGYKRFGLRIVGRGFESHQSCRIFGHRLLLTRGPVGI